MDAPKSQIFLMACGDGTYEKILVDLTVAPPARSPTGEFYRKADPTEAAGGLLDTISVYSPDDFALVQYVRVR